MAQNQKTEAKGRRPKSGECPREGRTGQGHPLRRGTVGGQRRHQESGPLLDQPVVWGCPTPPRTGLVSQMTSTWRTPPPRTGAGARTHSPQRPYSANAGLLAWRPSPTTRGRTSLRSRTQASAAHPLFPICFAWRSVASLDVTAEAGLPVSPRNSSHCPAGRGSGWPAPEGRAPSRLRRRPWGSLLLCGTEARASGASGVLKLLISVW